MQITPNFKLEEFACRDGSLYPTKWIDERLKVLCAQLEVIRAELQGHAVTVLSGYRSPTYNKKIGGAKASQHMEGRAADIVVSGHTPQEVHATILKLHKAGLLKIGGLGEYPTFTHVDIRPSAVLVQWVGSRTNN